MRSFGKYDRKEIEIDSIAI